jgi:hypothetical protein
MDRSGFEKIRAKVNEVDGARIEGEAAILGALAAQGGEIRYVDVKARTPAIADEVVTVLDEAGLLSKEVPGDEEVGRGQRPLLFQYGFTTSRNVPANTFPGLEEELRFEDLNSPQSAEEAA